MEDTLIAPDEPARDRVAALAFLAGNGISLIGNTLVMVALPWFVIETTGSAGRTGIIGMTAALPALLAGLFGGILVDRLGGRTMSVVSDIISGLALMMIPLLSQTVGLTFPLLVALVFVGAALDIPGVTARRALLPDIAERSRLRPEAMVSAFESMQSLAFIIGPAIAGALIALIGSVNLLWITASGFFVSAAAVALFAPDGRHPADDEATTATGAIAEIKAGWNYLRADNLLLWMAIGLTAINFLVTPFWGIAIPVLIEERLGRATQLGLLFTAMGLGSVGGAIAYGAHGHRFRGHRRLIYLIGVASFCLTTWLLVLPIPYWVLLGIVLVEGALTGPINPLMVNVRLERIPASLRGRVFATFSGLAAAAIPLGMLATGWVLERFGVDRGMTVIAFVATVATAGMWLARPLHEMDQPRDLESSSKA